MEVKLTHGSLGDQSWALPALSRACDEEARPGYNTCKASEFSDTPGVLGAKVALLAQLIQQARHCVVYTGAGISTASGISDYATKGKAGAAQKKKVSGFDAQPTLAHRALVGLHKAGWVKYWVQQNHDGLPQKAGWPQHAINEIHGAWYDPSNPVVKMSGYLRSDLVKDLEDHTDRADLCIAIGTSMCGMAADDLPIQVAKRARKGHKHALGTVIVNLQQTRVDELCQLRIFAPINDVLALVAKELSVSVPMHRPYVPDIPRAMLSRKVLGPLRHYDAKGHRVSDGSGTLVLNLGTGAKLRMTDGPNDGVVGEVVGANSEGHLRVRMPGPDGKPIVRVLGLWWLEAAVNGTVEVLPCVNND